MSFREANLKTTARFLLAASCLLWTSATIMAQGKPAGAGPPPNNNPNIDDRARQVDEGRLRSAETDVGVEERNQKLLQAAITNMKEDFSRIQIVRNEIARNLVAHKPLDYQLISQQTAEINKRASRLNVYMRAHAAEEEKENSSAELKTDEMVGTMVRLCKLIDSFTENPALKNADTVDSKAVEKAKENKANADRDLLAIIKLSGALQKKADNLKTSQ
jgi:hypothetical protein